MHMSKYLHCLSRDKLRKLTMTLHMLAQTDLLSWSKHFFVIFLISQLFLFYCHSFFWTQLLTVILLSHTQGLLAYFSETHIASLNTIDLSNLNCQSLLPQTLSHHDIKFTWLLYCVNTIFKNWEREEQKSEFSNYHNKKVNFSYWLSFLLLSQASYMSVSISSSSFLQISLFSVQHSKQDLSFIFLSTTRTKSLCWDHHRESLDCRPVRSFVSIHCHQQHHSSEALNVSQSLVTAGHSKMFVFKEQNFDTSVTALVYIKSLIKSF
jgi:hypothetical protein